MTIPAAIVLAVALHLAGCDKEPLAGEPRDPPRVTVGVLPLP